MFFEAILRKYVIGNCDRFGAVSKRLIDLVLQDKSSFNNN
jgi:hypothetical protein